MAYKKLSGIYKITSPTNKVYIGKSKNISHRKNTYSSSLNKIRSQTRLYNSIKKYGWESNKKQKYYIEYTDSEFFQRCISRNYIKWMKL